MSEDCLSVNVWTTNPVSTGVLLPVVVFIYGGRFASGSNNSTFYVGQNLAASGDVVYVNLNYRVGILGFPGAPGLTQNLGLLDQRLALEWVRSNIKQFGGDPNKIIIVGQSVGALSVDYHTYAWPNDPIAYGAMSISGTAASAQPVSAAIMEQNWFTATGLLGCMTSGDAIPCMLNATFQDIVSVISKVPALPTKALAQPAFQETIDEVVVFSDYAARGKAGKFANIPYLVGNLDNEAGFYKLLAFLSKITLNDTQWDDFNLQAFTCASAIEAANRVNNGITAYRYCGFFDFEDLRIYPTAGAYHGVDLNMWLGNAPLQAQAPNTPVEQASMEYMMNALIAFAQDPQNGLQHYGWPKYKTDASATLVRLGYDNQTKASFVAPSVYDGPCAAFNGDTSLGMGAM
ncbi:Alpha/Beta hydrolase protein [Xylogone sp. PMI_703]|nr:Alpha/Beta hydrolase protein [Xylogone sp. PMI_703]